MAKIFRRCLLLILLLPTARANEALRAVLAGVECPATKFNVRDGRELAAALERTLRQSPGGEDLCVTWIDRAAPPFAGDSWSAELTALPARDLLRTVCANAGVFWGLRHGGIALSSRPLRISEYSTYTPWGISLCGPERPSPLLNPTEENNFFTRLCPKQVWRPGQEPSLLVMERDYRLAAQMAEDDFPWVHEALMPGSAWPAVRVVISAAWIAIPDSKLMTPDVPLAGLDVRRMLAEGKARVRNQQTIATMSGINAVVEAVDEVIYPVEFDASAGRREGKTATDTIIVPTEFETREPGHFFNVTPTVNPDDQIINLQIITEWCQLVGWTAPGRNPPAQNPHHHAVLRTPFFRSLNITTSQSVRDNSVSVHEMGRDPVTGDLVLLHLHVRLLNADGTPRNPP